LGHNVRILDHVKEPEAREWYAIRALFSSRAGAGPFPPPQHFRKFLPELGVGFALVGSQYPLEVGGEAFKLDLLFYILELHA
jgi:hypothetical protein